MKVNLSALYNSNLTVAVALSGGSDSMALLYYMLNESKNNGFSVIAVNVEHGIRGKDSISDSEFVKNYCKENKIPLLTYSVNALSYAEENKLSIEQSARELRYECFFDAIKNGKCHLIATAHHQRDNVETVLFNLFRGTGLKGVSGITDSFNGKIIRPFISLSKEEIEAYILKNNIPFVEDQTNFSDEYARNFIRLNVLPKIREIFPEVEKSVSRFSEIARLEDDYLDKKAKELITEEKDAVKISLSNEKALFYRATIIALKHLGLKKDWEQVHVDIVNGLIEKENGTTINLPKNILAVKEYDNLVLYKKRENVVFCHPFLIGETKLNNGKINIEELPVLENDLKSGLFADADKIPKTAVLRTKKDGDVFTKFGGGTKKLCDYFTDKKIPLRVRDNIPLLCDGNQVLVIFNVGISDKIKIDNKTEKIIKFTYEEEK